MKKLKNLAVNYRLLALVCLFGVMYCISSCNKEELTTSPTIEVKATVSKDQLKKQFGYAFAKILSENKDIRDIVKEEALKKINYDYDVLYQIIKERKDRNGNTIEKSLLKYISEDSLSIIINSLPTLTIYVPELPEEAFSAEIWDTNDMIPKVAIRLSSSNEVPIVDEFENERILAPNEIPLFPVVVIKENERIVANNSPLTKQIAGNELNAKLMFVNDAFNNTMQTKSNRTGGNGGSSTRPGEGQYIPKMDSRFKILKEAYKKSANGWQRDYVYYGIYSSNPNGPFNNQYREYIWGFEMLSDPDGIIKKIGEQSDDPQFKGGHWTDGEFEFQVKTYVGSKTAVGNELITYFRVKATDLFGITGGRNTEGGRGESVRDDVYTISSMTLKRVLFTDPIPLFPWNLEDYSSSIKISIEEVDAVQVIRQLTSTDTEFAANFDYDMGKKESLKIGPKFGASGRVSRNVTYEVTTTVGNDELGQVIVNFGDPILKDTTAMKWPPSRKREPPYFLNMSPQYTTGWYRIYIAPGPIF